METEFRVPREIEVARSKEKARFENNDEYKCPVCQSDYAMAEANGHAVRHCLDHNVVMPIKRG